MVVGERPEVVPMSFAQRRLWFLAQLEGPSAAYNVPMAWRLDGPVDVGALDAAVGDVVARHEALRTVFEAVDGVPAQRVVGVGAWGGLVVRSCGEAELAGVVDEVAHGPFDLAEQVPIRVVLLETGRGRVLVVVMHHIASDGWSFRPLLRDLGTAYRARLGGGAPEWAELPVQYADYALWQLGFLGDRGDPESVLSRQVEFWTEALWGMPESLPWALNGAGSGGPREGGLVGFEVDAGLHARLVEVARANHCTLFMVLQAAFAVVLTRLGAGTDIPIGSPIAGRSDEALDDLVGFFVNTLVVRVDTAGDPTFVELLARVRERDLAAFEHQDLPFDVLVEALNPSRSATRHPLFQVFFSLDNNTGPDDLGLGSDIEVQDHPVQIRVAQFDLSLTYRETPNRGGLTAILEYATDLFDHHRAQHITEQTTELLHAITQNPHHPINELLHLG